MAKLNKSPIEKGDLLEYLNEHSDFSFELKVLRMLREKQLDCDHGGLYDDPVTKKSREFDIRAENGIGNFRVRLAVECKNTRDNFPILVSCVPRHDYESYHEVALVRDPKSNPTGMLTMYQSRAVVIRVTEKHSFYRAGESVGKSTAQVGRALDSSIISNDRELYERWGQCLSSAADLVERMYWDGGDDDPLGDAVFSTVLPIVAVPNGRLWRVSYDDDGQRTTDPTPTDRCSCFIGKQYEMGSSMAKAYFHTSHIELMTFDGLASFVDQFLIDTEGLNEIFGPEGIGKALTAK